jgi:RNA polymerase sigma factor (TIGR02999 family)
MLVKIRLNGELGRQDENQNQQGAKIAAPPQVAQLLEQVREGSRSALNRLTALLYGELQRLAKRRLLAQPNGHTLVTSDLVNETYLKLANVRAPDWQDRDHFLAVASRAMRSVLVDYARMRLYTKRGGGAVRVSLSDDCIFSDHPSAEVIAVDQALARLSELAPRQSQVVELRYFAGFSIEETAEALVLSTGTVKREWNMARAWLRQQLGQRKTA